MRPRGHSQRHHAHGECRHMGDEGHAYRQHRHHISADIPHTSGVDTACAYTRRDGQQRHDASYGTDTYGDSRGVLRGRPETYNGRHHQGGQRTVMMPVMQV